MACFLVSAAEAVVVKGIEKHEEKVEKEKIEKNEAPAEPERIPWSRKLKWLSYMLWGGVVLLAFEHVWHGEVVPWFPFLTAMNDPADTSEMLHEMATRGVAMTVLLVAVWVVMVLVSAASERTAARAATAEA